MKQHWLTVFSFHSVIKYFSPDSPHKPTCVFFPILLDNLKHFITRNSLVMLTLQFTLHSKSKALDFLINWWINLNVKLTFLMTLGVFDWLIKTIHLIFFFWWWCCKQECGVLFSFQLAVLQTRFCCNSWVWIQSLLFSVWFERYVFNHGSPAV